MTVPNEPLKAFMMMYTNAGSIKEPRIRAEHVLDGERQARTSLRQSPHGMPCLEPDRRQPFGRLAGLS
jgi:hypothetical protein